MCFQVVTYASVAKGHALVGDFEAARGVLEEMERVGIRPNAGTYQVLQKCPLLDEFSRKNTQSGPSLANWHNSSRSKPSNETISVSLSSKSVRTSHRACGHSTKRRYPPSAPPSFFFKYHILD